MADLFKRIAARLFGSSRPPEWLTLPAWKAEPLFDVSAMSDCRDPQVRVDPSTYTCSAELCAPHRSAAPPDARKVLSSCRSCYHSAFAERLESDYASTAGEL